MGNNRHACCIEEYNIYMHGFLDNLEEMTLGNDFFRKVVYTTDNLQLVLMSLPPGEEIGMEVHEITDQFFRVEKGEAKVIIEDDTFNAKEGSAIIVPRGKRHNIINSSSIDSLKLYTIYTPPQHKEGTIHKTKEGAESADNKSH